MNIDYQIIADAIAYYSALGYRYLETPWIVEYAAIMSTRPQACRDIAAYDGFLVASGEQGFIQQMIHGELEPGQLYQTVTPCYRDDPLDDLHQHWFLKLELIWYEPVNGPWHGVARVLPDARGFFERFLPVRQSYVNPDRGRRQIDLVTESGIELGSYGERYWEGHRWTYGTGVALPRLSIARVKETDNG